MLYIYIQLKEFTIGLKMKNISYNNHVYFFFDFLGFWSPPMSSAFQTDSGTACAQDGMAELGRENPAIACFIAATSPVE